MKKILVIEDDQDIGLLLKRILDSSHYDTRVSPTAEIGLKSYKEERPDMLILDLSLPDQDGIDVCRNIRRMDDKVPIFILTARNEEIDRIMGLELGADDYITKPFSIRELKARVDSFFRRWDNLTGKTVQSYSVMSSETELIRGSMKIDRARRRISVGDIILNISRKEFDIIFMLASNPGKVFSREMILREVWGKDWNGYERMIDSHIKRIRSKFEKAEVKSDWVETIWGVGYRFTDIY